ncbi:MAG: branched-chain amino acid ABC transporter permease [Nitrososphaeraceae archaeon]|nr:branched-chain amino acid ABC transporter permease [Nitrososphaeraceae archaeon]
MSESLRTIIAVLINGIEIGSIYVVMAIGLSLLFGVTKVFNYAYGSLIVFAGYIGWVIFSIKGGINYGIVFICVLPLMFGFGMLLEKALIYPLRRRKNWEITSVIVTLGFAIVLNAVIQLIFGSITKKLPPLFEGYYRFAGLEISKYRLSILLLTLVIVILLTVFLNKTKIGMAMKAIPQDMDGARIVGININMLTGITFGISASLAGISGIFLGSTYYMTPETGWEFFMKAFIIVALGGIGSMSGAIYAALLLGIIESIVGWTLGAMMVMPIWFLVLILILIIKPQGLLGKR